MRRSITRPLALAACLALVSAPAVGQGKGHGPRMVFSQIPSPGPLVLEWSDAEIEDAPWNTRPTADVDTQFLRLRLRGTEQHAGTWCRLRGRVSIAEAFFLDHPEPIYEGLRKAPPVNLSDYGFDVNHLMPRSIYPVEELFAFLSQAWPIPTLHSDAVLGFCEPILNPGAGATEAFRVWDAAYPLWSADTLGWWQPILATGSDTTILNMRALTEALILQQTGGAVGGEFFTSGLALEAAQLGMVLELQAETVVGSATAPEEFPQQERDPPPGLHGYPAPAVSSLVSYQFTGTGGSHTFPTGQLEPVPIVLVDAGQTADFRMNGLFNDTYARLRIGGDVGGESYTLLGAGAGIATARFRVPHDLPAGARLEIVGFLNPFGVTDLPSNAHYVFEVQLANSVPD